MTKVSNDILFLDAFIVESRTRAKIRSCIGEEVMRAYSTNKILAHLSHHHTIYLRTTEYTNREWNHISNMMSIPLNDTCIKAICLSDHVLALKYNNDTNL